MAVYFTDANTGYALGGDSYGGSGLILKTTNGGTSWVSQYSEPYTMLWSVCFTDTNTGYAVGYNGTILKTTNGGASWTKQSSGTSSNLYSVRFADSNVGYAVGAGGTILKTTNGGTSWVNLSSGTNNQLTGVYFTDANTGYVVGGGGTILKTTTGGTTAVAAENRVDQPQDFYLSQNYPNPFLSGAKSRLAGNPVTTINFTLPASGEVSLVIYNMNGQVVKQVAGGNFASGNHSIVWDATDARGLRVPSGVYLYVLKAGAFTAQRKLVLMK
jgi:photosystem II stability/assembly factor-like uncharacterized protein